MFTLFDLVLLPFYLILIYFVAFLVKSRYGRTNPNYKYFFWGLHAKLIGAIGVVLIYVFYYDGGDTTSYMEGVLCMNRLAFENFEAYADIMSNNLSWENYLAFTDFTGFPPTYMYKDSNTFAVIRFASPLSFLCFNSFPVLSVMLSAISYIGIWRLYLVFTKEFPGVSRQLAYAFLFFPSVIFWGSGLLKDSFTFAATCWFVYAFYHLFILRKKIIWNLIFISLSAYIIIAIKPYVLVALGPSVLVWIVYHYMREIQQGWLRRLLAPAMITLGVLVGFFVMTQFGDVFGKYSADNIFEVAKVTQEDLSREAYGDNSFNIGEFDASAGSLISKAPLAIGTALFRPFLWESKNMVMLLAGVENTLLLALVLILIIRVKLRVIWKAIVTQPMILFCLVFSLFFAFAVGLTTANFGALVRYKIPLLPFFASAILILRHYSQVMRTMDQEAFLQYVRTKAMWEAEQRKRAEEVPSTQDSM